MDVYGKAKRNIAACYILASIVFVLILLRGFFILRYPAYAEQVREYELTFSVSVSFLLILVFLIFPIRSLLKLGNSKSSGCEESHKGP